MNCVKSFNVCIEGNIGNGKSTLIKLLGNKFGSFVTLIPEPVELWTNFNGLNVLKLFYKNKKWAYVFQLLTLYSLIKNYKTNQGNLINIFERSLLGWKVFVDASASLTGDQRIALNTIYEFLNNVNVMRMDYIVHLKCNPATSYLRIKNRKRNEEDNISMVYIENLHKLHNKVFGNNRLPVQVNHINVESESALITFVNSLSIISVPDQ